MSDHTPPTVEELAEMKARCRIVKSQNWNHARASWLSVGLSDLPRCIAEIKWLRDLLRRATSGLICGQHTPEETEFCKTLQKQDVMQGPDAPAEFRHEGER